MRAVSLQLKPVEEKSRYKDDGSVEQSLEYGDSRHEVEHVSDGTERNQAGAIEREAKTWFLGLHGVGASALWLWGWR